MLKIAKFPPAETVAATARQTLQERIAARAYWDTDNGILCYLSAPVPNPSYRKNGAGTRSNPYIPRGTACIYHPGHREDLASSVLRFKGYEARLMHTEADYYFATSLHACDSDGEREREATMGDVHWWAGWEHYNVEYLLSALQEHGGLTPRLLVTILKAAEFSFGDE